MPTTKAELERLVEELQQKLEKAQQSKESIEAAVQATMTSHFEEELARAVAAERKRTNVVQQQLEAMQKTIVGLQGETELAVIRAKDALREDLTRIHRQDLQTKEELARLQIERGEERLRALELQLAEKDARIAEFEATTSDASDVGEGDVLPIVTVSTESGRAVSRRIPLPPIPEFNGEKVDDEDSFGRWTKKFDKHSEIGRWSEREKLLQSELHLGGRAEAVYETLPADVKGSFSTAVEALRKRRQPPKRDALRSAQLIRRKQQSNELVDKYAQDFELLFDKSYGQREGMDQASKGMLKRDLFVQGLMWKWQEKVLPSANSFDDALYQARVAEEQERQLSDLHRRDLVPSKHFTLQRKRPPSLPGGDKEPSRITLKPEGAQPQSGGGASTQPKPFRGKCRKCFGFGHKMRDCEGSTFRDSSPCVYLYGDSQQTSIRSTRGVT